MGIKSLIKGILKIIPIKKKKTKTTRILNMPRQYITKRNNKILYALIIYNFIILIIILWALYIFFNTVR